MNVVYTREERKLQVLQTLAIRQQNGKPPEGTMYSIAKALDMKPSSHLMSILMELVETGELSMRVAYHRANAQKRIFRLNGDTNPLDNRKVRSIPIINRGIVKAQMALL